MKPIQFILFLLLGTLVLIFFRRFRLRLLVRMIVLILGVTGIVMVAVPDLTHTLAHLVGVGRGADLITYLGLVGLTFLSLALYARLREVEMQLTDLARAMAIEHARLPAGEAGEGNRVIEGSGVK